MASISWAAATASQMVADRRTRLDGLQESVCLDDLEVVVAHRDGRARLERRVLGVTGTRVTGGHRLVLERRTGPDAQFADPPEVPGHHARRAVDLEAVGVLRAD